MPVLRFPGVRTISQGGNQEEEGDRTEPMIYPTNIELDCEDRKGAILVCFAHPPYPARWSYCCVCCTWLYGFVCQLLMKVIDLKVRVVMLWTC